MVQLTGDPKPFDISVSDPVQRIQRYVDRYRNDLNYKGFESTLMRSIRIISAENTSSGASRNSWCARAVFELEVAPEMCNPMDNMHGGAVALVADMATTMAAAPASSEGFWGSGGVSRTLGVTYLGPIPKGSTVQVDCKLVSAGKRLALLQCEIRDRESKALLAVAEHGKVAAGVQIKGSREGKNARS